MSTTTPSTMALAATTPAGERPATSRPTSKPAARPHGDRPSPANSTSHDRDRPKQHRKKPGKDRPLVIGDPSTGFVVIYTGDEFVVRHPLGRHGAASPGHRMPITGTGRWEFLVVGMPR
ncbi:hypothetical protein ACTI_44950 [Actinoplanes sp. OR16]|uniref:hypothetical protein n=1 Tax=Actinoplanes sp. OR16 TaxID=946334 RepID=UPI000F714C9A|nr:hypothetical protein [Actinoplanes sp. OR16]BBH67810.1 hypothetical protein ACTI_44950 [Actinoplanes sp. OR16]